MNEPLDQDQGSSTRSAGTEQEESEMMVLRSEDIVKLTNMELVPPLAKGSDGVGFCGDYHCNLRCKDSRQDHGQPKLIPTAHSLLQKQPHWMLRGDVCIDIEDKSAMHLKLKLSAGNVEESVKLLADLARYPKRRNKNDSFLNAESADDFIKSFVCTITFLDQNLNNMGDTRCFQFTKQWDGIDNDRYFYYNDNFCSQSALMETCQLSPEGANTNMGTSKAFEFIDAKIETTITVCLKEKSQVLSRKGSPCPTQAFQLKQSSFKEYPSLKTEVIPRCPLKFTEIVVLKAGDGSSKNFYVHKDKLIRESPGFARMLDVFMSEKTTMEVVLDDCTVPVLEAFIGFLYEHRNSRIEEDVDILLGVLALAHQKDVNRIVQHVKKMIISVGNNLLNLELALSMFTAGELYEMPDMKFRAVQWMKSNKVQLLTAEGKKHVQAVIDTYKDMGSSIMTEILTGL